MQEGTVLQLSLLKPRVRNSPEGYRQLDPDLSISSIQIEPQMSRELTEEDVTAITLFLSVDRLAMPRSLTQSERDAIDLHQEILKVGTLLIPIIAIIEISLRNTISLHLSQFFNSEEWLASKLPIFNWGANEARSIKKAKISAQRAKYSKLSSFQKRDLDNQFNHSKNQLSHKEKVSKRLSTINVSNGKIIAELTLNFWKRLFSSDYEERLWKTTLKKVFPNKHFLRPKIADQLEIIYQARNRLAHHEPVCEKRLTDTIKAILFVAQNLGSPSPSDDTPLAKLISDDLMRVKTESKLLNAKIVELRRKNHL
jgi:hypothetical protein